MNRRTLAIWQLSMLTAIHFTVDMLSGMLPGFLPRLLEKYTLSIGTGTLLLTLWRLQFQRRTALGGNTPQNRDQTAAGSGRAGARLRDLPGRTGAGRTGSDVAPDADRAGARRRRGAGPSRGAARRCAIHPGTVTPAVATSIFMLSGFLGYATGPLLGGVLLECFGFHGLYLMLIPVALLLVGVSRARVRLAKDRPQAARGKAAAIPHSTLTFWELFVVATLINTGCVIIQGLLPTYLNLFGFSLGFGGLSAMLFGAGAGLGALGTSFLIKKFETIRCIQLEILAGVPLLILYPAPPRPAGRRR